MDITVHIPDDLARRLGTAGEVERRALEALALAEYKLGHVTKAELRQMLGFETHEAFDGFLKAHDAFEPESIDERNQDRQDLNDAMPDVADREKARQAAANIVARRKGVTLGGLSIKDLINKGRP
jgi:hypothetical protein